MADGGDDERAVAKQTVDALVEMLQKRFHLEPEPKARRTRAISACFDQDQAFRFKQNILCVLGMMLSNPDAPTDEGTRQSIHTACVTEASVNNTSEKHSSALNEMLSVVAGALTSNHQPQYIPPQIVHSHLSVCKMISYREFGFRMSQLENLTPEQKVMYTRNQDAINELDSEPGGERQKSVHCYEIKDCGNKGEDGIGFSFETQYVVACSIDYIKKRFDLFSSSRVLCCDKYVYLIADSEDLLILSKVIVPYIELIFPMHKVNYGSTSFLASPLIVDALATAPPRSRMVKYAMWMLAAIMHRTTSTDPIDMLFKELVRDGDAVLACQGRALIIHLLGFHAQQCHDRAAAHVTSNSYHVYYECPTQLKARTDAIRKEQRGQGSALVCDDGTVSQHCTGQSPCGKASTSKKRPLETNADSNEGEPSFTEQDVADYKEEQRQKCIAHCFVKDMCLMANRSERWCMPSNVVDRLMESCGQVCDLPLSLAKLRNCILDGFQDPRCNVVKDVVVCRPTSGFCDLSRPPPRIPKMKTSMEGKKHNGGDKCGDGISCFNDTVDEGDNSTITSTRALVRVRKPNGRLVNFDNKETWRRNLTSLHKTIACKQLKKSLPPLHTVAQEQEADPPIVVSVESATEQGHRHLKPSDISVPEDMDSPMSDSPGSTNGNIDVQDTNHVSDSDEEEGDGYHSEMCDSDDSGGDDGGCDNSVGCVTKSASGSDADAMSFGSNITAGTNASAGNHSMNSRQSIKSMRSMRSIRSGRTATSMKSMERDFVLIPPQLLPALLFDLANHPSFSHNGDRFQIKRRVTFATGEKDAYNFLFTKNDDVEGQEDVAAGEESSAPPMPPDFNGTVATEGSAILKKKKKPNREAESEYKRLYTEALYSNGDSATQSARSRRATEAEMQWQLTCLLAMYSAPAPKDADAKSIENCALCPVHRRAVRYEYKMVSMDKLNLTRVDRGWIALEAHLVTTEEVIRNFGPLSHQIKGIHSVPRLHLTARKTDKQARKKLKKGHAFTGGAKTHGLAVVLNHCSRTSPASVLPAVAKARFSREAMHALSSSHWGKLIGDCYLHGLGSTGSSLPWQIKFWMQQQKKQV